MIREAIAKVVEGQDLTADEAAQVMGEVMGDEATPAQLGAFLTALRVKGETLDEITGMATVMRSNALAVDVEGPLVDTCGTGGDASHTFNISTTVGLVAAGAGLRVAKHGNRAASGSTGSADVLEELGVNIALGPEVRRAVHRGGRLRLHVRPDLSPRHEVRRRPEARDRHQDHIQHAWATDEPRRSDGSGLRHGGPQPGRNRGLASSSTPRASHMPCLCTGRTASTRSAWPRRRTCGTWRTAKSRPIP